MAKLQQTQPHAFEHAGSKLLTQFIARVCVKLWQTTEWADGMDVMCTVRVEALCFPGLLEDPLIQMVMDSDGVSAGELRELMAHMQEVVLARAEPDRLCSEMVG